MTVHASEPYGPTYSLRKLPADSPSVAYFPTGDSESIQGHLTCLIGALPWAAVGPYGIYKCRGLSYPGHTILYDYYHSTFTVAPAVPILKWPRPAAITYGSSVSSKQLDATAVDGYGDTVFGTFAYNPAAGTFLHAGQARTLAAVFAPSDTTDYVGGGTVSTTVDVNQANLLIAANDRTVARGFPLPALTWHANFVAGDTASSLVTQPVCKTAATVNRRDRVTSPPGSYPIACTGAADRDYNITYSPGTLMVEAPIDITGGGHQSGQIVTYTWTLVSGPQPLGFNVLGVSNHGKVIRMNKVLVPAHAGSDYTFVAQSVKVDVVRFYVNVKTSAGFMKFGPFSVTG